MPAQNAKVSGSPLVSRRTMLAAVSFNDQPTFNAGEVGDARSNRFLLLELEPAEATVTQVIPKPALGVGCFAPETPRMRIDFPNCRHGCFLEEGKPSPNPLPHAGEG